MVPLNSGAHRSAFCTQGYYYSAVHCEQWSKFYDAMTKFFFHFGVCYIFKTNSGVPFLKWVKQFQKYWQKMAKFGLTRGFVARIYGNLILGMYQTSPLWFNFGPILRSKSLSTSFLGLKRFTFSFYYQLFRLFRSALSPFWIHWGLFNTVFQVQIV